ncbi:MAG: ABC transporter substrate-binding protein [Saccharospirillaceae bacterium]|nr:ABC transporter substrate-binding protein [Saccharospirillaceae bacterium]MCD8532960.1 ABC transporter substrate-binding protein [Saccharospirillaceae bacterium]
MRIALQTLSTFAVFIVALMACAGTTASEAQMTATAPAIAPRDVVASATLGIINELNKLQPEQRTEDEVRRLVQTYIVPAIDQEKIAMGALGKYWRRANPEQRQAFIDRFRELQIRTYSGAFQAFNGEQFVFEEARFNDSGDKALVKGTLKQNNGNTIPVDFRLYRDNDSQQWRIYDAVIAGLGMVKTYREQLSERLQNISMNELLAELSAESSH